MQSSAVATDRVDAALALDWAGRREDARTALIAVLHHDPANLRALDALGTWLADDGAIAAACRVFSEAIASHPDAPHGHVGLGGLLLRANEHATARTHFEAALRCDPDNAQAHQGLGAVLADAGDLVAAAVHFRKGFEACAVTRRPYRGAGRPVRLLQLVAAGPGNVPTAPFLDERLFETTVVVADCVDRGLPLPVHDVAFNAIGDADRCRDALDSAEALLARSRAPLINPPSAVRDTGRVDTARRLGGIAGVVAPRAARWSRAALVEDDAHHGLMQAGFGFPLLLRSPGCHTGRNFLRIDAPDGLRAAADALPGDELLVIEYRDARGGDSRVRKYRVMMIGGALYPLHLAIARDWKVHYFTADMADRADHRAEEDAFLRDMPSALGAAAIDGLRRIQSVLGLDYCGIDFGLDADGHLIVFEANATMVISRPSSDPRWDYRRAAIDRAIAAATAMVTEKLPR